MAGLPSPPPAVVSREPSDAVFAPQVFSSLTWPPGRFIRAREDQRLKKVSIKYKLRAICQVIYRLTLSHG